MVNTQHYKHMEESVEIVYLQHVQIVKQSLYRSRRISIKTSKDKYMFVLIIVFEWNFIDS